MLDFIGGRTRTRTWDPLIKSQLLYQLSYAPGMPPAGDAAEAGSCSKAVPRCPAKAGGPLCTSFRACGAGPAWAVRQPPPPALFQGQRHGRGPATAAIAPSRVTGCPLARA